MIKSIKSKLHLKIYSKIDLNKGTKNYIKKIEKIYT